MSQTLEAFFIDAWWFLGDAQDVEVELRTDGTHYWTRATPKNVSGGAYGHFDIGTIYLQTRYRHNHSAPWGPIRTRRSRTVYRDGGNQWTDSNFKPESDGDVMVRSKMTTDEGDSFYSLWRMA